MTYHLGLYHLNWRSIDVLFCIALYAERLTLLGLAESSPSSAYKIGPVLLVHAVACWRRS